MPLRYTCIHLGAASPSLWVLKLAPPLSPHWANLREVRPQTRGLPAEIDLPERAPSLMAQLIFLFLYGTILIKAVTLDAFMCKDGMLFVLSFLIGLLQLSLCCSLLKYNLRLCLLNRCEGFLMTVGVHFSHSKCFF